MVQFGLFVSETVFSPAELPAEVSLPKSHTPTLTLNPNASDPPVSKAIQTQRNSYYLQYLWLPVGYNACEGWCQHQTYTII